MIENSADALSYASGARCTGKYAGNCKTNTVQRRESTGSGETYNIISKRHNKVLFPVLVKAVYASFYKPEKAISNVVNYRIWIFGPGPDLDRER